jgi:hypothetical protein
MVPREGVAVMMICYVDTPMVIVLGFILALVYAKRLKEKNPDWWFFLLAGITAIFWLNALLTVLGVMQPWFGLLPSVQAPHRIVLFTVLSYPLWYIWSGQIAMSLFGHDRTQAGMVWPFTIKEKSDPFKPSWKSSGGEKQDC